MTGGVSRFANWLLPTSSRSLPLRTPFLPDMSPCKAMNQFKYNSRAFKGAVFESMFIDPW